MMVKRTREIKPTDTVVLQVYLSAKMGKALNLAARAARRSDSAYTRDLIEGTLINLGLMKNAVMDEIAQFQQQEAAL
jgi:hypothetical protein